MIVTVQLILVSLGIFFRLKAHKFVHFKYISSSTGFRYWMKEFKQQTNGQTTSFHIVFPIKNKISFRIEPLGLGTALLLKMGLTNRFKTGDAEFDESFFVASDQLSLLKSLEKIRNSSKSSKNLNPVI